MARTGAQLARTVEQMTPNLSSRADCVTGRSQAPSIGLFSPFRAEGVSTGNALLRAKKLPKKLPTIERALYKAGGNPTGPSDGS